MSKLASKSWYPWLLVGLLWIVAFLNYLDRILITTMRDPIVSEFSLTDAQFGLLTSVFLWSYGILSPFGGYLADKYSRRNVIIFSVAVWSLATAWTGYVSSYEELLVARIVMGVSEAFYIPAGLALITDYHRGKTRSLATGIHFSGLYVGLALGGVGGYIAEMWGWRYGFHLFGFFGCLYALVLLFFLRDRRTDDLAHGIQLAQRPQPVGFTDAAKTLVGERSYLVLLFYFVVLGIANWLIYAWLPTFLRGQFSLGLGEAGLSATLYPQIGSLVGVLLGGFWADWWSKVNRKSRILVIVIGFTVGAPFLILMSWTSFFLMAIMALFFFGMARGFSDANLMPVIRQVIGSRYAATAYGVLNFLSTIAGGLMVYVGGALKDADIKLSIVYIVAACLLLVATWSLMFVRVKQES